MKSSLEMPVADGHMDRWMDVRMGPNLIGPLSTLPGVQK